MPEKICFVENLSYKTLQASLPRTGSNLLRKNLEAIFNNPIPFNYEYPTSHVILMHSYLAGSEGHLSVGNGEFITRSHFPSSPMGYPGSYHKIIIPFRNPFDYIYSLWYLFLTMNHEQQPQPHDLNDAFPTEWAQQIQTDSKIFAMLFKYYKDL